jgi:excisionase family DNA binding protein
VNELAGVLGVGMNMARALTSGPDPEIPVVRIGRSVRVSRAAVDEYLAKGGSPQTKARPSTDTDEAVGA